MKLYSFYDYDAEEYSLPFGAKNNLMAMKYREQVLKDSTQKESIGLVLVGDFNTDTGFIYKLEKSWVKEGHVSDLFQTLDSEEVENGDTEK